MRSLAAAMIVSSFLTTPAVADELFCEVPAYEGWTDTGLYVHAGEWLELEASGVIVWGGRGERSDPAGSHGGGFFRPLDEVGVGALIGNVGEVNFYIGRGASLQAPASGELRLGINDDKFGDNRGSYQVNVRTRYGGSGWSNWHEETYDPPSYRRSASRGGQDYVWWRGRVDGSDYLVIREDSLSVRHLDKLPIQNQDYNFSGPLPAGRTRLRLNVIRARGRVELVEQPDRSNDYTAVILLDDNDEIGAYDYELELSWDRPRRHRGDGGGRVNRDFAEAFRWKGSVDKGVRVEIRGRQYELRDEGGQGTHPERADFSAPLPSQEVAVSLRKIRGRGDVVLVQTPEAWNQYTAVVAIQDPKSGDDTYEFELSWTSN